MNKTIAAGLLLLLVTACGNEEAVKQNEEKETPKQEIVDSDERDNAEENEQENDDKKAEEEEVTVPQEPLYEINEGDYSIQPIDTANEKVALVTIDDAPDQHALEMAKVLKELNAPAVFFVNGHFLDTQEEKNTLKKIYDMGFEIGNHTYSHVKLTDSSIEEQQKEIVSLNDLVESITGERPKFFRAPFGINTDYSRQVAQQEKMALMNWTYGYDWEPKYQTKEAIADIMVNSPYLNNGANLLMHDRAWTSEALGDIVKGLRDKGYELVDPDTIKTPAS
ncbi:polysaccharide deacetylase family protein [Bacillus seohaeanensis]|jgi:peptidoglycan-N-acetylglucosamine deacetylase|uniref:Polysaccharide deacetylase family protein n=1 Tax=Bacillus seohaeanensis TaxID=284580 RepID=A0ABW5RMD9_9BACI